MRLLNSLFKRNALTDSESWILAQLSHALSDRARETFRRQLQEVNLVQRGNQGREVRLYSMRGGKPFFNPTSLFPNTSDEILLGKVVFGRTEMISAEVWLAFGRVFSIEFSKAPRALTRSDLQLRGCEIVTDPNRADGREPAVCIGVPEWLGSLVSPNEIRVEAGPIGDEERHRLIRDLDVVAPQEYLDVLRCGERVVARNVVFHGPTRRRRVPIDGELLVIAENESWAIALKSHTAQLYVVNMEEGSHEVSRASFVEVIAKLVELTRLY